MRKATRGFKEASLPHALLFQFIASSTPHTIRYAAAAIIAMVKLIAAWREVNPAARWMMVSNFPDAHQAAEQVGGLPGFGKRDIGSPRVTELLRSAITDAEPAITDVKSG